MQTRDLLAYGDAAIQRLRETLMEHPQGFQVTFSTLSAFKGVKDLVAHLVGAEERWYDRTRGLPPTARYEDNAAITIGGIFADWQLRRDRLKTAYNGLNATELSTPIPLKLSHREELVPMTWDQIVYHLINHQIYHTGQISMALQQASIDPPNFDYTAVML